jgi:hypothetical protein
MNSLYQSFKLFGDILYDCYRGLKFTFKSYKNNLIQENKYPFYLIYFYTCGYTIFSSFRFTYEYIYYLLRANKVRLLKDNHNESILILDYTYEDQCYSLLLNVDKTKPKQILNAYKGIKLEDGTYLKEEDISILLKKLLGPNENFHNYQLTPSDLDMECVIINRFNSETLDVEEYIFSEKQIIKFS